MCKGAVMIVQDAMTRHVITISMDATLREAKQVFDASPFHHLIVTEQGKVVGVISDRDLLQNLSPFVGKLAERSQDLASLDRKVHQIMSRRVRSIGPGEPVAQAGRIMLESRISCLPVVDENGRAIGIITIRDVARVAIEMLGDFFADLGKAA